MEAATHLRRATVSAHGDRVAIDGLVVQDETAARLVREREQAGADPAEMVADAIEIGARVLDREQTGANAEFVKTEFEKVSKSVEAEFGDRARAVAEQLGREGGRRVPPRHRAPVQVARGAVLRRQLHGGAAPREGAGGRGAAALTRRPAQAVRLHRRGRQPAGGLQGPHRGRHPRGRRAPEQEPARAAGADARAREAAPGPARREAEARGAGRRARARHRQGAQLRGGGGRGDRPRGRRCRATRATPWATSRAPAARRATSWWAWTAARGRRAGGSSSRPRTAGSPSRSSSRSSTRAREQRDADFAVLVVPGRGRGAGAAARAARVPGRQDDRRLRPRGRLLAGAGVRLPRGPRSRDRPARGRRRDRRRGRALHGRPCRLRDGRRSQDQVSAHHRAERDRRRAGDGRGPRGEGARRARADRRRAGARRRRRTAPCRRPRPAGSASRSTSARCALGDL